MKIALDKKILATGTLLFVLFSLFMVYKILRFNFYLNKVCQKEEYYPWTREVQAPLTPRKKEYLNEVLSSCQSFERFLQQEERKKNGKLSLFFCEECHGDCPSRYYGDYCPPSMVDAKSICSNWASNARPMLSRIEKIEKIEKALEKGYYVSFVPDKVRREKSRKAVNEYKLCLERKKKAQSMKPETYKLLLIGDVVVLVATVAFSYVFRQTTDLKSTRRVQNNKNSVNKVPDKDNNSVVKTKRKKKKLLKRPLVSSLLAGLIPGLGRVYMGKTRLGITTFIVFLLFTIFSLIIAGAIVDFTGIYMLDKVFMILFLMWVGNVIAVYKETKAQNKP